jgi:predicted dehydrogenase
VTVAAVVVGAGNAARLWFPTLRETPLAEVRAIVDVDADTAERLAREFGIDAPVHRELAEAVERYGADLVIDLTPPSNRVALARAAFALGCDVFAEKPMAPTLAEARELIDLSRRHARCYAVMQNRRFHPGMRALRAAIARGELGEPALVCADFYKWIDPIDRLATMPSPLVGDMAIHTFDQARFLLDAAPVRVHAHEWNPAGSQFAGDAAAVCTFEFANGAVFSYRGSWTAVGRETTWFASWRVLGSRGTAVWDGRSDALAGVQIRRGDGGPQVEERRLPAPAMDGADHPPAITAMLTALAAGEPLETDCADNIRSLAMVTAALESSRAGSWVRVEQG